MASKVSLGEVCDIISGATPKTERAEFWGGDIPWATPKDISDLESPYLERPSRSITNEGLKSCATKVLPINSVLLSSRAPIGLVAINTIPVATNQGFKSLVPSPRILDSKFLYYWLKSKTDYLQSLGNGATFKEISKAVVERIEIPLLPLDEQQRIAVTLDRADALRRKRKRTLELLDGLAQSTFVEIFGDPIGNPRGYPTEKLFSLVDQIRGISYGIVQRGDDLDEGVGVIRISDFQSGRLDTSNLKKTSSIISGKYRRTILRGGELVISIRGTVGRCAEIPENISDTNVSREVAVIPTLSKEKNKFYLALIRSHSTQRRIAGDIKGVAQSGINLEDVRALKIIQPNDDDMKRFDIAMNLIEKMHCSQAAASVLAENQFETLQHRAFSD